MDEDDLSWLDCPKGTPPCSALINDFADVMLDSTRWPKHLCEVHLRDCLGKWLRDAGLEEALPREPLPKWGTFTLFSKSADPWRRWPLPVGRLAFDAEANSCPSPRGPAFAQVRTWLPFDGMEYAILAVRAAVDGQMLDFLGLVEGLRVAPEPQPVSARSAAILRGDRLWESSPSPAVLLVLQEARKWWAGLCGAPVRRSGRRSRRIERHPAKIELAKQAWSIREREPKLGWDKIAAQVGGSGKTLQRYCEDARLGSTPVNRGR